MDTLLENLDKYFAIALQVIGAFAAIAAITPNDADNRIARVLLDIINKLGFNVGNARNG
jgi:hypothetical protein